MAEFRRYAPAVGLRVGLAIGQSDFAQEQRALVGPAGGASEFDEDEEEEEEDPSSSSSAPLPDPLRRLLGRRRASHHTQQQHQQQHRQRGGRSRVDILVATPGRLMDHMERTPGFTLQHLRYLVLDEVGGLTNNNNNNKKRAPTLVGGVVVRVLAHASVSFPLQL